MFCSQCACELPAIAKYCVRCGTRVTGSAFAPLVQSPSRSATIESDSGSNSTLGMFCVNCGQKYHTSDKFCNFCGHSISPTPARSDSVAEEASAATVPSVEAQTDAPVAVPQSAASVAVAAPSMEAEVEVPVVASQSVASVASASYSTFVLQILGAALLASTVVFELANEYARGRAQATFLSLISALVFVVLTGSSLKRWRVLRDTDRKNNVANTRKLVYTGLVFAVLFTSTAGLVGYEIGKNGSEAAQMTADFSTMSSVGDRISQARSGVDRTITSHIGMYKTIEPDVEQFDQVLRRLRAEVAVYDEKFPNQHDQTGKTMHSIEIGIRRAALLKKEIEVAKALESLDPNTQWNEWQREMQPLLDEEDSLEKSK